GGRVPQPRRPVAAGGQQPPVRAERHAVDEAVVAGEGAQELAGGRVPQPRRPVAAGGGQQPPVRAERHAPDPVAAARGGAAGPAAPPLWRRPPPAPPCGRWLWPPAARRV